MKKDQKQSIIILTSFVLFCCIFISITMFLQEHRSKASPSVASSTKAKKQPTATPLINIDLETTSARSETAPISSDTPSDIDCQLIISNTWTENDKLFSQLAITLTNKSKKDLSGWQISMGLPKGSSISQSWCGTYTIKQDRLEIMPVDYNTTIPAGTSIDIGCIITSTTALDPNDITLNGEHVKQLASKENPVPSSSPSTPTSPTTLNKVALTDAEKAQLAKDGDWLYTKGNKIIDKNGQEVWLTGLNWFGYNTGTNAFDGLWNANLDDCIKSIADHGFNLIRIPISAELINNWANGSYPTANINHSKNSHLTHKNSQEIFDYMLGLCKTNGIKVMLDIHSAETDPSGHMTNVWYTARITEADYLSALSYMANRYVKDDTIIAFDLKNEPHGKANETPRAIWNDSKDPNNWKYIAEKAADTVLSQNPNVLIMVEGTEIYPKNIKTNSDYHSTNPGDYYCTWWGGNLRGVKDYPIDLGAYQNKLVYSPHDYGPSVYEQPWFKNGYTYNSLYTDCWKDNWFFIYENKTAPLLIGEWGGFMSEPNLTWMTYMRQLISKFKLNHTFWCYNPNSGDTGGLVLDDFTTWDEEKYNFVKEVLWQKDGKFVGLDQEIPLGSNGISLQEYCK